MPNLRLGRLPDRTPVKLAISVMPDLHHALLAYARVYQDTYGQAEALSDLIPHMLAAFLDSDRAFTRSRIRAASNPRSSA